jgi:hypothetical protein
MSDTMLKGDDATVLRQASLFRKMRALTRAMRKGTAWQLLGCSLRHPTSRFTVDNQCPLTFTAGIKGSHGADAERSANRMGFDNAEAKEIMWAADAPLSGHAQRRLRRVLFRAAGLKEGTATMNKAALGASRKESEQ